MSKPITFLSNRGYSILKSSITDDQLSIIKKELTVSPKIMMMTDNCEPIKFPCFLESSKKIYIPKYYGITNYGLPDITNIKMDKCDNINIQFKGELRPNQINPVNKIIADCNNPLLQGGLLSLPTGFGKTSISLYVIAALKVKTMVVVHKSFLLEQWIERINFFLPDCKVGLIKGKIIDTIDKDIILTSLQSLSMKEYNKEVFKGIGLIINDECHHLSAEVFSRSFFKYVPKYSIGLSATMTRKDGLTKVFKWHIGDISFKILKRDNSELIVDCYNYYNENSAYSQEIKMYNGKVQVPSMISKICNFEPRNDLIIEITKKILDKEPNRNILILSDRREHLKNLKIKLESHNIGISGLYMGGMKQEQLKNNEEKCNILLGSFSFVSEGFDNPKLDTLILTCSKPEITQAIGRILRKKPEERIHIPLVIDIIDDFSIFPNQAKKRMKFYKKNKYTINYENNNNRNIKQEKNLVLNNFSIKNEN